MNSNSDNRDELTTSSELEDSIDQSYSKNKTWYCSYPCCDLKFETESEFKIHISNIHDYRENGDQIEPCVHDAEFSNEATIIAMNLQRKHHVQSVKINKTVQQLTNGSGSDGNLINPPESNQDKKSGISRWTPVSLKNRNQSPPPPPSGPITRERRRRKDASSKIISTISCQSPPPQVSSQSNSPTPCVLCNLVYRSYTAWEKHAINYHIYKSDPKPVVEMNYVDIDTLSGLPQIENESGAIITTSQPTTTPGRGQRNEKLKLTFCKEKGNYVVKNPSFSDDLTSLSPTVSLNIYNKSKEIGIESDMTIIETCNRSLSPLPPPSSSSSSSSSSSTLPLGESSMTIGGGSDPTPQYLIEPKKISPSGEPVGSSGIVSKVLTKSVNVSGVSSNTTNQFHQPCENFNSYMVINQCDIVQIGVEGDTEIIQIPSSSTPSMLSSIRDGTTAIMQLSLDTNQQLTTTPLDREQSNSEKVTVMPPLSFTTSPNNELNSESYLKISQRRFQSSQNLNEGRDNSDREHIMRTENENNNQSSSINTNSSRSEDPLLVSPSSISTENRKNSAEINLSKPFHITLPCGIQIDSVPIPTTTHSKDNSPLPDSQRRDSANSTLSEDIDVGGLDDDGRSSKLVIDENSNRVLDEAEVEDFRCRVCNVLFTSDEELETHFGEVHFRGIAHNILEPESPYVGGPETPAPPPAHASSQVSIFSRSPTRLEQERSPHHYTSPGSQQDYMRDRRGSVEEMEMISRGYPFRVTPGILTGQLNIPIRSGSQPNVSRSPVLGSPGSMTATDRISGRPLYLQPSGDPRPQHPLYSPGSGGRPTGEAEGIPHRNPSPHALSRSPGLGTHPPAPFPFVGSQRPQTMGPNYPNALHNALNSVVQLGAQQRMSAPASRRGSNEPVDPNQTQSSSLSAAQHQQLNSQLTQAQQQRNQLLAIQQHRQQQQYQLLQQQSIRSRQLQHEQQRQLLEMQRQVLLEQQRQATIRAQSQNFNTSQIQGKRSSSGELQVTIQKQSRLEATNFLNQDGRTRSFSNSNLNRTDYQNQVSTTSHLASALGNGGMRVGSSVTLSLCPVGDEASRNQLSPNTPMYRNSMGGTQNQPQGSQGQGNHPTSVATALAVRGVTVSPASPSSSTEGNTIPTHRLPPHVSISPNSTTNSKSPETANSVSVIQNGNMRGAEISHPFALPHNPAPRHLPMQSSSNADRPDRPPTVDLTADEAHAMASNYHLGARYPGEHHQRIPTNMQSAQHRRPTVACNLCGLLFNSVANLEEHKLHRHGIRPPNPPPTSQAVQTLASSPPIRNQPASIRTPVPLSSSRSTITPSSGQSSRSLFIPILDLSRMDSNRIKKLEEFGICSMIPVQGNERSFGQMGIPIILPTLATRDGHQIPWDQLQPIGPILNPNQLIQQHPFGTR